MKKSKIIALIMAVVLLTTCLVACGKGNKVNNPLKSKKLIMGIDPEYNPFSYMGKDGKYTGFDVEVCQAVCDYLGWELEIFGVNWDQKLIQLDNGECDLVWSGMTILDSMKEKGYIISRPYFDSRQVLVVKEGAVKSSADLKGKDVAVQLGTSGEKLLQGDLKSMADTFNSVVTCDSFLKCFTELEGGAVEAVFVDSPVATKYVSEHKGLKIIDENLGVEQYGIAFRSGDAELCAEIEKALDAIVENGKYAEIAAKYPDIVDNLIFLNK